MKKTTLNFFYEKIKKYDLPTYSNKEEKFNWISHLIGLALGVVFLVLIIFFSKDKTFTFLQSASLLFYLLTLMILYFSSVIYHFTDRDSLYKKPLRLLDHSAIYFLIAGTYAPIWAFALNGSPYGIIIIIIELVGLLIGVLMNLFFFNSKARKIIEIFLYVIMGWVLILIYPAIKLLSFYVFLFVLLGGLMYTFGVLFYTIGKKRKWMHGVFHIFVLLGTIFQFIGIIFLFI